MIHILVGGDTKSKSIYIKELTGKGEVFFIPANQLSKDILMSYSNNVSLFNESPSIILENILNEDILLLSPEETTSLKESKTIFIIKEDKLLTPLQKKFKKYGDIKIFEEKKVVSKEKFNIFSLTDAYAGRDKIKTWVLFNNAVLSGIEGEAIAGVLFWKIKTMILNGNRLFSKEELKHQSSNIVSLYHKAHRGESDFNISLEQFILSSLSSR
jgi:hypothetical protein